MKIYIQTNQLFGVFCEVLLDLGLTSFTRYSILVLRSKIDRNLEKVNATLAFDKDTYEYRLQGEEFYTNRNKDNDIYKLTIKPEYRKKGYFEENYCCLIDYYYNSIYDTIRKTIEKEGLYLDSDRRLIVEKQNKYKYDENEEKIDMKDNWIPIQESLPPDGEEVLLTVTFTDKVTIGDRYVNRDGEESWSVYEGFANAKREDIIAWRPLPEPYEESEG